MHISIYTTSLPVTYRREYESYRIRGRRVRYTAVRTSTSNLSDVELYVVKLGQKRAYTAAGLPLLDSRTIGEPPLSESFCQRRHTRSWRPGHCSALVIEATLRHVRHIVGKRDISYSLLGIPTRTRRKALVQNKTCHQHHPRPSLSRRPPAGDPSRRCPAPLISAARSRPTAH